MTNADQTTTYRYVADGSLTEALDRDAEARLRHPALVTVLVIIALLFGLTASLGPDDAFLPDHPGRFLLSSLAWGFGLLVVVVAVVRLLVVPLARVVRRRWVARLYPPGSVTELELTPEALLVRRPGSSTATPWSDIVGVKVHGPVLQILKRRGPAIGVLPVELLPPSAVEDVLARSRGLLPPAEAADDERATPDRQVVVRPGWATHVAAVTTRGVLRRRRFWLRFVLALLVCALLAWLWRDARLMVLAPVGALLSAVVSFELTRRAVTVALPVGSVATTTFLDDRVVSHNAGGVRHIPYAGVESADVRGDVVLLGLRSGRPLAIARALLTDDVVERFRRGA